MKVSLNWLKDYLEIERNPDEISEILTTIGLEVEGQEKITSIKGGLEGVIVGHIISCEKHPDANRLSLTKVDVGREEILQIVCGAPNVAKGQKVLVAQIGTTLYDNEGAPRKIKKGKIRGQLSEGMICAEDELGLGKSHDGILVLDNKIKSGTLAKDIFEIKNDVIYEIGLTPNRSDATSHLGVAKDLAAYLKVNSDNDVHITLPNVREFKVDNNSKKVDIEIVDVNRCPRYAGLSLSGISIKESPEWLQNKLKSIGVKPISNVVDVTNFVLHEYGQPLHAFDLDKIAANKIIVKTLEKGTKFTTLDGVERTLTAEDLMICDGNGDPMCIGGVFGGSESGISDNTTNIFLEAAHFEAKGIRKTSTKHLLRTDAAKCFEKGSDPNKPVEALKRAATMIQSLAGATITSEIVDIYPIRIEAKEIQLAYQKINDLIGNDLSKDDIHKILTVMDMEITPVNDKSIKVKVPTDKADVLRDVDLIEEILRIYGFNKIEIGSQIKSTLSFSGYPTKKDVKERIINSLIGKGFQEMMNLSLIESSVYENLDKISSEKFVFINNTSNIHLNIMRPEMMLSGLRTVVFNLNRQQSDLKLFEYGKTYRDIGGTHQEEEKLSLYLTGKLFPNSWNQKNKDNVTIHDMKGYCHHLLHLLNISSYQTKESKDYRFKYGLNFCRGKESLVEFGKVDTSHYHIKLNQEVYYAEFDVAALNKAISLKNFVSPISKFPVVKRDLALVVDENVSFEEVLTIAKKTDKKILKSVDLFDVYKSTKQLGKGKKSYAVSFTFENLQKTLKDKDIEKVMKALIIKYEKQLKALIRS